MTTATTVLTAATTMSTAASLFVRAVIVARFLLVSISLFVFDDGAAQGFSVLVPSRD
jgi:hypothetical protein